MQTEMYTIRLIPQELSYVRFDGYVELPPTNPATTVAPFATPAAGGRPSYATRHRRQFMHLQLAQWTQEKLQEETELTLRDLGACNSPIRIQPDDTCSAIHNSRVVEKMWLLFHFSHEEISSKY